MPDETPNPKSPSDRFPALKPLEEQTERAKLRQALAEAQAATVKATVPSLDVDVEHDTIVMSDKSTGLARVLVQLDSLTLADDVADRALDAARAVTAPKSDTEPGPDTRTYAFRVIADPLVFKDIDAYRLLEEQLVRLRGRIDAYAPGTGRRKGGQKRSIMGVAAAVGLGIQAVGLASKLFSREYTLSGSQVSVDDLGFDLEVAHSLTTKARSDEEIAWIKVDRVMPTPESTIVQQIEQIALDADERLTPKVAAAAAALRTTTTAVEVAKASITALDTQILELSKLVPVKPTANSPVMKVLAELTTKREEARENLPALGQADADAKDTYDRGAALIAAIESFVTVALTPSGSGIRPPALQAARAEALLAPSKDVNVFVLYSRLIAGGIDQEIERKLGSDRYIVVAGATAEFALLNTSGQLLDSKVLSLLEASTMKLGEPRSFERTRLNYMGFDRDPIEDTN